MSLYHEILVLLDLILYISRHKNLFTYVCAYICHFLLIRSALYKMSVSVLLSLAHIASEACLPNLEMLPLKMTFVVQIGIFFWGKFVKKIGGLPFHLFNLQSKKLNLPNHFLPKRFFLSLFFSFFLSLTILYILGKL